jgi:hypothetical protein
MSQVTSPMKSMAMSGKIETKPYRLSLRNVYDNSKKIDSRITFDPENRLLDAQINYDIGNLEFHSKLSIIYWLPFLKNENKFLNSLFR